jgi:4-hydroxybenzoate polyprenyltransferase
MQKEGNFINLLKATRIKRALIPLSFIVLIAGLANTINLEIILLMICSTLMYSIGGIINAKIDKDYELKYSNTVIAILFLITITLSLYNYIILITVLLSIILGYIYSKYSRFILFGDSFILSLTHSTLPIVSASILLNLNFNIAIMITIFSFLTTMLVIPIKNLKGVEEDKRRGYRTLMTIYKNGEKITIILLQIYFVSLFLIYFILDLEYKFTLILMSIFLLKILIDTYLNTQKIVAYKLTRLIPLLFTFGIVYDQTTNNKIIFLSFSIIIVYLFFLLTKE